MTEEERAIQAWPNNTTQERQAQVDALILLAEASEHPYDAHHGTDRSVDSLEMLKALEPAEFERISQKIEAGR